MCPKFVHTYVDQHALIAGIQDPEDIVWRGSTPLHRKETSNCDGSSLSLRFQLSASSLIIMFDCRRRLGRAISAAAVVADRPASGPRFRQSFNAASFSLRRLVRVLSSSSNYFCDPIYGSSLAFGKSSGVNSVRNQMVIGAMLLSWAFSVGCSCVLVSYHKL